MWQGRCAPVISVVSSLSRYTITFITRCSPQHSFEPTPAAVSQPRAAEEAAPDQQVLPGDPKQTLEPFAGSGCSQGGREQCRGSRLR